MEMPNDKPTLCISSILPNYARRVLFEAVQRARSYPEDSFERRLCIDSAIDEVQTKYPQFFKAKVQFTQPTNRSVVRVRKVHRQGSEDD